MAPRILFSKLVTAVSEPLLSSKCATAQSKLPSKLPGAAVAVITKSIGLRETFKPSKVRSMAPVCSVRIVQVPVKLARGMLIAWLVIVPTTPPAVLVNVPVMVPTAFTTPFTKLKLFTVNEPVNVPILGITCMIAVVSDPLAGGGTAGIADAGAATIAAGRTTISSASKIATLLRFCICKSPSFVLREDQGRLIRSRAFDHSGEQRARASGKVGIWRGENLSALGRRRRALLAKV